MSRRGEGGLEAPIRHPLGWQDEAFYDAAALEAEMRRVFEICHGCRRCFNLCDAFPRLFDLIDATDTGEVSELAASAFEPVVEACTLCDMCFMTKCPYVPPHEFNLDFPHLMLRHRAVARRREKAPWQTRLLARTDLQGRVGCQMPSVANWATRRENRLTRPVMSGVLGIARTAPLPRFYGATFLARARREKPSGTQDRGRAVLFATCFVNHSAPRVGIAALRVLRHLGVAVEVVYPGCCAMPFLEHGDLPKVAQSARRIASELRSWCRKGYDVITLTASCGLMFRQEWPSLLPDNEDVQTLARATKDIDEYVVDLMRDGARLSLSAYPQKVAVHLACHGRAHNVGPRAKEMLGHIPEVEIKVVERCSGHGGTFGIMTETREAAVKVGRAAARACGGTSAVLSECPLAARHLSQAYEDSPEHYGHPIELLAHAAGLLGDVQETEDFVSE